MPPTPPRGTCLYGMLSPPYKSLDPPLTNISNRAAGPAPIHRQPSICCSQGPKYRLTSPHEALTIVHSKVVLPHATDTADSFSYT